VLTLFDPSSSLKPWLAHVLLCSINTISHLECLLNLPYEVYYTFITIKLSVILHYSFSILLDFTLTLKIVDSVSFTPPIMGLFNFIGDVAGNTKLILDKVKLAIDNTVEDIHHVGFNRTLANGQSLLSYVTQMETGQGVDDRQMRQENFIAWLYTLPQEFRKTQNPHVLALEHVIIQALWDTLPHPSPSWEHTSGPQYRLADGSNNNPSAPDVGKAGSRYIRDVVSINPDIKKAQEALHSGKGLPDPALIFEKLMRRRRPDEGGFKPHPCGKLPSGLVNDYSFICLFIISS
jgi:hypothetical protein